MPLSKEHILIDTDSYKVSHWKMFPEGSRFMNYYLEARGNGRSFDTKNIFYGLQPILKELSRRITAEEVELANKFWTNHGLPFNYDGWMYIVNKHDGKLPLKITAVDEGMKIDQSNVLVQVINTDPECFWLPGWVETKLLRVWYPITVASLSYAVRQMMESFAEVTQDNPFVDFSLHDFGSRGVSSNESAGIGGSAHMLNFSGSDTAAGMFYVMENYGSGDIESDLVNPDKMPAFSIPASEHSTITSYGREREQFVYSKILKEFPTGLVACVSDSYDIWNAVDNIWGDSLKAQVLEREGTLVVRPDSGDPVETPIKVVQGLWEAFGGEVNSKGYKVLNPNVRVIQGDGVNYDSIKEILEILTELGFSSENIAFGMGGELLQKVNRDDFKFAYKASAININGDWHDVFKQPIGDSSKASKKGIQKLVWGGSSFETVQATKENDWKRCHLRSVFENGKVLKEWKWQEVKDNGKITI